MILQNKLPPKLKDPGSFTIPCMFGDYNLSKVLCDLGAGINLMPYSIFRKLSLGEVKEMNMTLQLADRSIRKPKGLIEDALVKIDKFIFPVDFVVLDMEEDQDVPLILGRPFLATARALIDVQQGQLILRLNDDQIIFDMYKTIKNSASWDSSSCFQISGLNEIAQVEVQADLEETLSTAEEMEANDEVSTQQKEEEPKSFDSSTKGDISAEFLDEKFFSIQSINAPWFADFADFHVGGWISRYLTYRHCKTAYTFKVNGH